MDNWNFILRSSIYYTYKGGLLHYTLARKLPKLVIRKNHYFASYGRIIEKINWFCKICIKDEIPTLKEQTASKINLLLGISKRLPFSFNLAINLELNCSTVELLPNLQYFKTILKKMQTKTMSWVLNCEYRAHQTWMFQALSTE